MASTSLSSQADFLVTFQSSLKKIPIYLSVFVFLGLVIISLFLPSRLGPTPHNWFAEYAQALTEGKLYLGEATQWRGCKWDQSFFEGKCYLYFGIVPALFHLAFPFITNRFFSILMTTIFVFFFSKTILKLSKLKPKDSIDWLLTSFLLLTAVFATSFVSLALSSRVYDETICFSHAFGMAGIYFALPLLRLDEENLSLRGIICSTLMFILASLTRFTWFGPFGLFCIFVFFSKKKLLSGVPFLGLGFALCFQGWLNWVRFRDPREMGMSFQSFAFSYQEKGRDTSLNTFSEALKMTVSYYFLRFFPEGSIAIKKTHGFLQDFFLKDAAILFESPHTLSLSLPAVFFPLADFRDWWRYLKTVWGPLVLASPLVVAGLLIPAVVHRYQFEVSAPFIMASLPYLISHSAKMGLKTFKWVMVSCLFGIGFSIFCTWEIIARFWNVM